MSVNQCVMQNTTNIMIKKPRNAYVVKKVTQWMKECAVKMEFVNVSEKNHLALMVIVTVKTEKIVMIINNAAELKTNTIMSNQNVLVLKIWYSKKIKLNVFVINQPDS